MGLRSATLTVALASFSLTVPGSAQDLQQIHVDGVQSFSLFGESIAMDGLDMIVGSRWDNQRANNAGAAFVFSRENGNLWEQIGKLTANDGRNSDYFGSDVDVSGNWAVVGASGFNRRQGAAYVFQKNGNSWTQRSKIVPSGRSARSVFGSAVSIDGNFIAVGAPDHFRSGSVRTGAVYVYSLNSGNWSQHSFVMPNDAGSVDYVGTSVALSGDLLAIGAPGDGQLRGSVYIFRRNGTSWVQQQKLQPNGGRYGDGFGMSLSMDENWLAVGAPHDDEAVSNQGTVHIYRRNGNSFTFDRKVSAADPRVSAMFGFSISVAGDDLLVGAPSDLRGAGSAYRFSHDGSGRWRQQVKLTPEEPNTRAAFGRTVALGASDVVVGATGETGAQFQSGAVYSLGGGGILRQGFYAIETDFKTLLRRPKMSFADADGDGDLDFAAYGVAPGGFRVFLYKNEGEDTFDRSGQTFDAPEAGFVGWSDIDNNGAMDLLVSGDFEAGLRTDIYLNDGSGQFNRVDLGIPGLMDPKLEWADYDNDGDQDVLVIGTDASGDSQVMLLEQEAGHKFVPSSFNVPNLAQASADWGDFDNDSDPDLLISGIGPDDKPAALLLRKMEDQFREEPLGLPSLAGAVRWVDFTSDGLLDIFLCGQSGDDVRVALLRNEDRSAFREIEASLPALQSCSGSWADFDNDGDVDLALSGSEFGTRITDVYENEGDDGFNEARFKLSRVSEGDVTWVDYDRDGRLDLAVAGRSDEGFLLELYKNQVGFAQNEPPGPPERLRAQFNGREVTLRWRPPEDDHTASDALTFNLRVGSTPGGIDVLAPNTTRNGFRSLSRSGNVGHAKRFELSGLSEGIYYWSIQAVDDGFEASEFSPEHSFVVGQSAQDFTDVNATIAGVKDGTAHMVDFRRTGYLDLVLTGNLDREFFAGMYRYRSKSDDFSDAGIDFPTVTASAVAFGDYDNDEDLDFAVTGISDDGPIARIYRNDRGGKVTDISAPLVPVRNGAVEWADLDNDGDVELIVTGHDGTKEYSAVYANNRHDEFSPAPVSLIKLSYGSIDVGDFDGDLDNDILLTGFDGTAPRTILYRNDGYPRFGRVGPEFVGVSHGDGAFEDYDGDGDLDILISGRGVDGPVTQLYENLGSGLFRTVPVDLPNLEKSAIAWGDYDNNGKMDVLLSGSTGTSNLTTVHRYMGRKDGFQVLHIVDLPATSGGGVAVGDYDRDGRLDMLVSGEGAYFPTSRVIKNEMSQWENSPPSPPAGLNYLLEGNKLHLFWEASQDAETPTVSLTYDLRIGTTHGGTQVMAPNTRPGGSRLSVERGNVGHNRRWTIIDPPKGRLTVSVHAIDGGRLASQSSAKLTLEIGDDQSSFTSSGTALPGLSYGRASWVDLDEDGSPDVSIIGGPIPDEFSAHFINQGDGEFVEAEVAIPALAHATVAWGDYDRDGDDDLYLSGETESGFQAYILRNDPELAFIDTQAPLDLVESAAASWADVDGDEDLDLIVSGLAVDGPETVIYRNEGDDTFNKTTIELPGVFKASHDWFDFDQDGDLDLLLTGSDGTFPATFVLENSAGGEQFQEVELNIVDVFDGSGDWVDVDSDGDTDIVITGHAFEGVVAKAYLNDGGHFAEFQVPVPGVRVSSTSWGDFDGDGDVDLAVAGWDGLQRFTKVFGNAGGRGFAEVYTDFVGVSAGSVEWADADGDGDLDLLVAGSSAEASVTNVYLFDSVLGSGKGDVAKLVTATESAFTSEELPLAEDGFLFKQSYPNPFSTRASVQFAVGKTQHVKLAVYNVLGQLVDTPFDAQVGANLMTNAAVDARSLSSGAYFLRIEGETFADTQTVVVNK